MWGEFNKGKMVLTCWLPGRRAQQKDNGSCSSNFCLEVTQLSLSMHVSGIFRAVVLPLEPRVYVYEQGSICLGPLRGHLDF